MKWMLRLVVLWLLILLTLPVSAPVAAQEDRPFRILFLHHSTGHNLIEEGGVREGLSALGYAFFDHGYNGDGLRLADGTWTGENFNVPGDNTDPDGLAEIFSQPLHDPPDNTFSYLMQYDVIAFKSCFPASNIADETQLAAYQQYYLTIRDRADQYPEKLFVAFTPPPQVPNNTNPDEAARARVFANWMASDAFLGGHPNLVTFNFFDLLAGPDNYLRPEYRVDDWDAHPNALANETNGPILVGFLDQAIQTYFGGDPPPVVEGMPAEEIQVPEAEESEPDSALTVGDQDLEETSWHTDSDGTVSSITCSLDQEWFASGSSSLHVNYSLGAEGYASCGNQFDAHLDWSAGDGVQFNLHADRAGQTVTLMIFSGGLDDPVPFEVDFMTTEKGSRGWEVVYFSWADFVKSDWYGEGGLAALDPTRIISFAFGLDSMEPVQGNFWVDGFRVYSGEAPVVADPPAGGVGEESDVQDTQPDGNSSGGICPFTTLGLPLVAALVCIGRIRKGRVKP